MSTIVKTGDQLFPVLLKALGMDLEKIQKENGPVTGIVIEAWHGEMAKIHISHLVPDREVDK